jgi:hypothetical protein
MSHKLLSQETGPPLYSGLPEEVFTPGFKDIVTTSSGAELYCAAYPEAIHIMDMGALDERGNPCFQFVAEAKDRTDSRAMNFLVRTVHPEVDPPHHPDLRAAGLFDQAVNYFDATAPLTHVKAQWFWTNPTLDTNYRQFCAELDKHDAPTTEQLKAAAFATWTGRQALRKDFEGIESMVPGLAGLTVLFAR